MWQLIKRKRKEGYRGVRWWGRYEEDYAVFREAIDYEKRVKHDGGKIEDLICVQYALADLSKPDPCRAKGYQLLYNFTFDCGVSGWTFDPNYPALITDNGDGSVHLQSESNFGSLVPVFNTIFPVDTYIVEIKVRTVNGTGKISVRDSGMNWYNSPSYNADGVYSFEYTGNIKEIHVGANDDINFKADYEYISLKLKT